jgi:hypothetical protein
VGKIFGLGDKLANLDMGAQASKDEATFYKQQAEQSFENLGPLLRDAVTGAVDTAQTVVLNSADMVSSLYGDIGLDFKTALDEIVAPDLEAIAQKADAANQTKLLSAIASSGEGTAASTAETAKNTKQTDTRMGSQIASILSDGLTSVFTGLFGDVGGGLMGMVATEMLGGVSAIISTLQPIIDIIFNTLSPLGILLTILQGFVSVMEPALTAVFQPLVDTFTWIGSTLASLFLPLLDALHTSFALVANILMAILSPVLQAMGPIFQVINGVLTALSPILILVAKAFTVLMSPLEYVADLFSWLGSWVQYLGSVIATAAYNLVHPFRKKSYASSPGSFSSDAFSGLSDRLANIDAIADQGSVATDAVSTTTAVGNAGYQGATQVTINIYQNSPVVGSDGMRAFAQMIRGEFERLDYYGVTT